MDSDWGSGVRLINSGMPRLAWRDVTYPANRGRPCVEICRPELVLISQPTTDGPMKKPVRGQGIATVRAGLAGKRCKRSASSLNDGHQRS